MHCAIALVALGVGYLVYLQASKEKEGLKLLGQVIGIVIMIGALLSSVCAAKCKMMDGDGHREHKAPMCPMSMKAMDNDKE